MASDAFDCTHCSTVQEVGNWIDEHDPSGLDKFKPSKLLINEKVATELKSMFSDRYAVKGSPLMYRLIPCEVVDGK